MTTLIFKNNAKSTLASSLASGATSLTIQTADAGLFPSPSGGQILKITIEDLGANNREIVHCTARSGAVLTIVRAQEGTLATDFDAGATVQARLTQGALELIGVPAGGSDGQALVKQSGTDYDFDWEDQTGGTPELVYTKGATWVRGDGLDLEVPANDVFVACQGTGEITKVTIVTEGGPGSCVIDIWRDELADFPPTVADSITAAAKPTISSDDTYEDSTLTGWDTAVIAGNILAFHLESVSGFSMVHIQIEITQGA
jgi:hypothetical protein